MLAVIDCGTTNTRIYLVNEKHEIVASDEVNVGVRDTSISGSKEKLRNAVQKLFDDILGKVESRKSMFVSLLHQG